MSQNYPFPIYFILLIITIPRLISTVGKTEQWKFTTKNSNISQKLINDPKAIELASSDYGNLVHEFPAAVFQPSTVNDIVSLVKLSYNSSVPFLIAARGQGHSTRGQAMARDGVVVDMKGLRRLKNNNKNNEHNNKNVGIEVFEDPKVGFGYYVDVGGEQLWIDVLYETLEYGLAPVSWTDYLYLTIGGTLSNAGISGQTFRYGPQITSVHQLDVVTGKGEFVTCSKQNNSELFNGVLGGLGQFGIITRARIALEPAPKRVKWVRLLYSDFSVFTKDQERLISMKGNKNSALDYLEGMVLMNQGPINNWRSSFFPLTDHHRILSLVTQHTVLYCLEIAKYYDYHSENNVNKEIQVLLQGLNYIPGFHYEKNVSFVEFLNRVRSGELKLQSQGLWDVPHPWLNMFIPKSRILDFNLGVFKKIIQKRNITTGPVLVYPMNRNKWDNEMSATIPDDEEDIFYAVGFLHSSGFDNWKAFDAQNKEILQFCNHAKINYKLYLPHYSTQEEWTNHFGPKKWKTFLQRKNEFDPRMILSPGQRIFNNN
ncbi:putative cytokinin dehydrogenase [Medicago truncatula]|uniref:cytokinin dehydrogenase n=1 Tax=Medicago truncatula TaxID=3880 RepID=A2Q1E3_MEDTR|nr:cytokinin dehydrogenase 3 [Medicago truncatula]ABN05760.1 FAD linked oxidase, N-terminal [Medicago truncatula]AES65435.1 cytokinin oxidase/dehydrogenase-like protein [Medicago truncatula]RHN73519.1 putative cytokinin dehydrogenase [Medicago truncatula]